MFMRSIFDMRPQDLLAPWFEVEVHVGQWRMDRNHFNTVSPVFSATLEKDHEACIEAFLRKSPSLGLIFDRGVFKFLYDFMYLIIV